MKKNILVFIIAVTTSLNAFADTFKLLSTDIFSGKQINNAQVLNEYGCHGENISPQLSWNIIPSGTKSFAITMYDPDAPKGWWHWIVFNIPSNITKLDQDAGNPNSAKLPASAVQSQTSFDSTGYGGPCPPIGDKAHRYIVTVYALKTTLPLDTKASAALVEYYIKQNIIAESSIIATYRRG